MIKHIHLYDGDSLHLGLLVSVGGEPAPTDVSFTIDDVEVNVKDTAKLHILGDGAYQALVKRRRRRPAIPQPPVEASDASR